jgi:hypothetical protein
MSYPDNIKVYRRLGGNLSITNYNKVKSEVYIRESLYKSQAAEIERLKDNHKGYIQRLNNLLVAVGGVESDCREDCINSGETEWGRRLDIAITEILKPIPKGDTDEQ